ncbi:MAG: nucleotidyltransferase family protein [Bacteroidales bacterium]|nr:nucleotidyltransferase family protein [Bacteroidales bacterium]
MTNKEALFFVGKCLSLSMHPERANTIRENIQSGEVDWRVIVYQSSNQLVVPALYLNLKRNHLLSDLPEDLISYFEEITNANRVRNQQILSQVENLSKLLNSRGFSPVFLKGSAHLIDGLYEDIAERMVGDIDFILEMKDVFKAYQILLQNGYHQLNASGEVAFGASRHLPRLVSEDEIAGVEVHGRMLNGKYAQLFGWEQAFSTLKAAKNLQGALVLSDQNLILNNSMNVQLNDKGNSMFKIFLRQSYDLLLLSKRQNPLRVSKLFNHHFEILNNYIAISAELFDYPKALAFEKNKSAKQYIQRIHFIWEHPKVAGSVRLVYFIFFRLYRYIKTILLLFVSASTRKRVFKSLSDPSYIRQHFEQYKNI